MSQSSLLGNTVQICRHQIATPGHRLSFVPSGATSILLYLKQTDNSFLATLYAKLVCKTASLKPLLSEHYSNCCLCGPTRTGLVHLASAVKRFCFALRRFALCKSVQLASLVFLVAVFKSRSMFLLKGRFYAS